MKHRAHIDGLRAVAVLPVVLFHSGAQIFSGGYVGVDVFFVISGYLITGIIAEEIRDGRFSLAQFYERRIRRIFPALMAVMAVTAVAAVCLLLPDDLLAFSRSLVATVFFVSNVFFWRETGYFDGPAETKPLLHTWSLAVEEQFYIVFPVVLFLVYRYAPRWRNALILIGALGSFALSVWGVRYEPGFTFYMAPTRAWELLAGSMLALGMVPTLRKGVVRELAAALGLVLIAVAVFAFTKKTPFPGVAALLPVLGAVLVIHAGEGTLAGRLLSWRPVVFIGLISYSLYLWHWPIIVFIDYYRIERIAGWWTVLVVGASILAAWLSWRFVEQPFRIKSRITRRGIFAGAIAAMAAMTVLGGLGLVSGGWTQRFSPEVVRLASFSGSYSPRRDECHTGEGRIIRPEDSCVYGASKTADYAIWGDSHAVEVAYAMGEVVGKHGGAIAHLSSSSCPPAQNYIPPGRPTCSDRNREVLDYLVRDKRIGSVFLIANYAYYMDDPRFTEGFKESVDKLAAAGKRVILIYPLPYPDVDVPSTLARQEAFARHVPVGRVGPTDYERRNARVIAMLDGFDARQVAGRVYPEEALCRPGGCDLQRGRDVLYFDTNHLSVPGARYLNALFEPFLETSGPTGESGPRGSVVPTKAGY